MMSHIPPKGLQIVRYAVQYASCMKRRSADIANAVLEALREQILLFATETLLKVMTHLKWRERIKASFGCDPLSRPNCGCTIELAEIWEPQRGYIRTRALSRQAREAVARDTSDAEDRQRFTRKTNPSPAYASPVSAIAVRLEHILKS